MIHRKITIKEWNKPHPIVTYDYSNKNMKQVIEWFGLNEPDVEWYNIEIIEE